MISAEMVSFIHYNVMTIIPLMETVVRIIVVSRRILHV